MLQLTREIKIKPTNTHKQETTMLGEIPVLRLLAPFITYFLIFPLFSCKADRKFVESLMARVITTFR